MAESLKDVIAKLKQNSQAQQTKSVEVKPTPAPVKQEVAQTEDEDEFIDEELEQETAKEVAKIDPKDQERVAQILEEIEMLQNNGRFRAELLHQMQEINQALVVIAGALADLSKHDKA